MHNRFDRTRVLGERLSLTARLASLTHQTAEDGPSPVEHHVAVPELGLLFGELHIPEEHSTAAHSGDAQVLEHLSRMLASLDPVRVVRVLMRQCLPARVAPNGEHRPDATIAREV